MDRLEVVHRKQLRVLTSVDKSVRNALLYIVTVKEPLYVCIQKSWLRLYSKVEQSSDDRMLK